MSFLFDLLIFIREILFFKLETPCTLSTLFSVQEVIINAKKNIKIFL